MAEVDPKLTVDTRKGRDYDSEAEQEWQTTEKVLLRVCMVLLA